MAGAQLSTQRLVPLRAAKASTSHGRTSFAGSRVAAAADMLRPRGIGQILDFSLDVFARHFALCVGIATLLQIPVQFGAELVMRSGLSELYTMGWDLLSSPVQSLTTAFVCAIVGRNLIGKELPTGEALSRAFRKLPGLLFIALMTLLATILGLAAFCVGTYVVQWLLSVASAVYVLEDDEEDGRGFDLYRFLNGVFGALGRSYRLTVGWPFFGRWLGWFWISSLLVLPFASMPTAVRAPAVREFLQDHLALGAYEVLLSFLSALFVAVGTALFAVVMTVYYVDCRVRKEGLDIERRLSGIADEAGGVSP